MKFNEIDKGIDSISMPEHNEIYNESDSIQSNISQHELMNAIHQEFQRSFIRKLYPNTVWTNRVFWVVANNIENNNENVELYEIIHELKKYLIDHNLPIPVIDWSKWENISDEWKQISKEWGMSQRDCVKLIRDIIRDLQQDYEGKAPIDKVLSHALKAGVDASKADDVIRKLKREGAIFEPRNGYLKST